jgi:hypothetical protein
MAPEPRACASSSRSPTRCRRRSRPIRCGCARSS